MAISATLRATPRSQHAKNRPELRSGYGKPSVDPYLEDALLSATALCGELATTDLAELARAGDFSASWASEIRRNGGRGGFLHKTTTLCYRLASRSSARAWALVAHFKTVAKQGLMPTDDAELVARFFDLLDMEAEAEGQENAATARLSRPQTRDLGVLKRAALAEAGVQEELAAVVNELERRRIDPWAERFN